MFKIHECVHLCVREDAELKCSNNLRSSLVFSLIVFLWFRVWVATHNILPTAMHSFVEENQPNTKRFVRQHRYANKELAAVDSSPLPPLPHL